MTHAPASAGDRPVAGCEQSSLPSVSVVIPCYNAARTLAACLVALHGQTRPPSEIVVVDDASSDQSSDIARSFGCQVTVHPVNRGVSAARNTGAAAASGDVIFFLDSDVALYPDAIENALSALVADSRLGVVQGIFAKSALFPDSRVESYRVLHEHHWRWRNRGLVNGTLFALTAIPKDVYTEAGPFDERLRDAEDVEYGSRLPDRFRILMTDAVQGRHDEVDRFWPLLNEQFRRAQFLVPMRITRRWPKGGLGALRPLSLLTAPLVIFTLPLGFLSPFMLMLPVAALLGFALADPPLRRFVRDERGPAFLMYFLAVHLAAHLAVAAGAAWGALRWMVDRDFGPSREADAGTRDQGGRGGAVRKLVSAVFTAAVLGGVAAATRGLSPHVLLTLTRPAALGWFAGAIAANMAGVACTWASWQVLLDDFGIRLGLATQTRIFFVSFLSKFLPGPVWPMLAQVRMGRKAGVAAGPMIAVFMASLAVSAVTGAAVAAAALPALASGVAAWLLPLCAVLCGGLVFTAYLYPRLPYLLINRLARLARRPSPLQAVSDRGMRRSILAALVGWAFAGLHLWLLMILLGASPDRALPVAVGGFAAATIGGAVLSFLPDGLGVREVLLLLALSSVLPVPTATAAAIASRLVSLISELAVAAPALAFASVLRRRSRSNPAIQVEIPRLSPGKERKNARSKTYRHRGVRAAQHQASPGSLPALCKQEPSLANHYFRLWAGTHRPRRRKPHPHQRRGANP